MKMTFLFTILFFAVNLHAQSGYPPLFFTPSFIDIRLGNSLHSRKPENVTLAAKDFKDKFEKNYNELPQSLNYHKHDSIHMQWWFNDSMTWINNFESWVINYDCNSGKAVNEIFTELDFTIENDSAKIEYEYYITGGLKSVSYSWTPKSASVWVDKMYLHYLPSGQVDEAWYNLGGLSDNNGRITYEYNQDGQIFKEKIYSWSPGIANWYLSERYTYFYDTESMLILKLRRVANGSTGTTWKDIGLWHYRYDDDNRLDTILYQTKATTSTVWKDDSRTVYTYLTDDQPNIIDIENYIGSTWVPKSRQLKEYDANGQAIEVQYKSYQASGWQNDSLWTISYHPNNVRSKFQYSIWDTLQNDWLILMNDTLDADGHLLVRKGQVYEPGWGIVYTYREEWTWFNNQIESMQQYFQPLSDPNNLIPGYKYLAEFDSEGLAILSSWQNWVDTAYVEENRADYFNSTCVVNSTQNSTTAAPFECSFANPGTPGQLIVCDELPPNRHLTAALYDAMGRLVHQQPLQSNSFSLNAPVANGLYFLVVRDETQSFFRKKVVLRER